MGFTAGSQNSFAAFFQINGDLNVIPKIAVTDTTAVAYGINDLGMTVGASGSNGFLYDIATAQLYNINDFDFSSFNPESLVKLIDINNENQFIGLAEIDGIEHGVVGQLVPEPSTATLAAFAIAGLIAGCRRRHASTLAA